MWMPELVKCPCGATAKVKLKGTMPRGWFARYIGPGNMPRYCSEECLKNL